MTTGIIIQARMSSYRFPGKVAAHLMGKPVLEHVIRACKRASVPTVVAVACPMGEKSEPIRQICSRLRTRYVEGPEQDVLARYIIAANALKIRRIVRITADCPFLEPRLIDEVVLFLGEANLDYASNIFPQRSYPKGQDVEAFTIETLRRAGLETKYSYDREHVTPYMQRSDSVRKGTISQDKNLSHIDLCVDVPSDIARLERMHDGPMAWRMGRLLPRSQSLH